MRMNVAQEQMTATNMQSAKIPPVHISASASQVLLEMDINVKVTLILHYDMI